MVARPIALCAWPAEFARETCATPRPPRRGRSSTQRPRHAGQPQSGSTWGAVVRLRTGPALEESIELGCGFGRSAPRDTVRKGRGPSSAYNPFSRLPALSMKRRLWSGLHELHGAVLIQAGDRRSFIPNDGRGLPNGRLKGAPPAQSRHGQPSRAGRAPSAARRQCRASTPTKQGRGTQRDPERLFPHDRCPTPLAKTLYVGGKREILTWRVLVR